MKPGLILGLVMLVCQTYAQFNYTLFDEIEVEVDGKNLSMPWAGGINSAQINTLDINGDNKADLVIFDRSANKLLTYLNIDNSSYQYAPGYESLFPTEITQWVLLRDLNCDGKKDIFTSDPFGMIIFINTTVNGKLSWRKYNNGLPLLTKGFTSNINLKVNETDIPALDDVDGDGDLDVLNVRFVGLSTVEYHKNFAKERSGKCDTLQLERVTQNFGNFEECSCGQFAFGKTCAELGGGRTQHTGGKALLTIDINNDGDKEILFAEESCPRVFLLENQGNAETAVMTTAVRYPLINSIGMINFPAAFHEDVDFDNVPDLLSSPNLYARGFLNADLKRSLWFYKNTGTKQNPQFTFQRTNFLQNEMIDVGDYAVPAFADLEGDGDLDMFVSNYAAIDFISNIALYENTGTISEPKFKFITNDYLNFSLTNYYNLRIQFADINGDGTIDLVFSAVVRNTGAAVVGYVPNRSVGYLNFTIGLTYETLELPISSGEEILVNDINQDGLKDFLVGTSTGAIEYWKNIGSANQPKFILESGNFNGFGSNIERQSPSLVINDLDADGKSDLIIANQQGNLHIYPDFRNSKNITSPLINVVYNSIVNKYEARNLGGRIAPVVANLFNTDKPALVVGNVLGGIYVLKNEESNVLVNLPVVDIYPNPANREDGFMIKPDRKVDVQFFTILGQKISESFSIPANEEYPIKISGLPAGIYLARFSANGKILSKKFVLN